MATSGGGKHSCKGGYKATNRVADSEVDCEKSQDEETEEDLELLVEVGGFGGSIRVGGSIELG